MLSMRPVLPADEIDAIASKRETAQREMERRIVAQMLACMDDLSAEPAGAEPVGSPGNAGAEGAPGGGAEGGGKDLLQRARRHVVVIGDEPSGVIGVPASAWRWWDGQDCTGDLSAQGMQWSQIEGQMLTCMDVREASRRSL